MLRARAPFSPAAVGAAMAKDTPEEAREQRRKQRAHGAQSDQGDRPLTTNEPKPEPAVYEGPEESNQQRR